MRPSPPGCRVSSDERPNAHSQEETPVYNADRRSQPHALYAPTEHAPESAAAVAAPRRRTLTLATILKVFSWMSEVRAMPFSGVEPSARRGERPAWDY